MDSDFWAGVRLITKGLGEAVNQATFALAFGAGALGVSLLRLKAAAVSGTPSLLIAMGAFFMAARIGQFFDSYFDLKRKKLKSSRLMNKLEASIVISSMDELNTLRSQFLELSEEIQDKKQRLIIQKIHLTIDKLFKVLQIK